jgi:hypothetical protein
LSYDAAAVPSRQATLLTISETARRAGISRRQVRNAIAGDDISPVYINDRAWIPEAECERFRRVLHPELGSFWCNNALA